MRRTPLTRKTPLRATGGVLRRTALRAVSSKRARDSRKRRAIVKARIGDGTTRCEAQIPDVCTGVAQDVHEVVRRSQADVWLDESVMKDVCRLCHDWIGANPNAAEALGLYVRGATYRMNRGQDA